MRSYLAKCPSRAVGLHRTVPAADREDRVMGEFAAGTHPPAVATTVIEVGVDVPEATG